MPLQPAISSEQLEFLRPQVELANNELYILFSAFPKHAVERNLLHTRD
jgi:hypothetical protein